MGLVGYHAIKNKNTKYEVQSVLLAYYFLGVEVP